jgi:hypothetical protein
MSRKARYLLLVAASIAAMVLAGAANWPKA